ncbi:hypothetical protein EV189_0917 [Motilibacter rhizosphaerae]|uniref:Secreted protein n=1 Tax=Motilibacter rhizosphaerae TaxID=598652 RepID=A0A4Q7NXE8_9ACTN|nr:hypothetical protein EV189_0917 [Motilibacter rhizosphaerae]
MSRKIGVMKLRLAVGLVLLVQLSPTAARADPAPLPRLDRDGLHHVLSVRAATGSRTYHVAGRTGTHELVAQVVCIGSGAELEMTLTGRGGSGGSARGACTGAPSDFISVERRAASVSVRVLAGSPRWSLLVEDE